MSPEEGPHDQVELMGFLQEGEPGGRGKDPDEEGFDLRQFLEEVEGEEGDQNQGDEEEDEEEEEGAIAIRLNFFCV